MTAAQAGVHNGGISVAEAAGHSTAGSAPEALLERARAMEERKLFGDALLSYYRAIIESQRKGRWLDQATTPPGLLSLVAHAMRFVKAGRRKAFDLVLDPVYRQHGREALR